MNSIELCKTKRHSAVYFGHPQFIVTFSGDWRDIPPMRNLELSGCPNEEKILDYVSTYKALKALQEAKERTVDVATNAARIPVEQFEQHEQHEEHDQHYAEFIHALQTNFNLSLQNYGGVLFATDAFDGIDTILAFIRNLPNDRQYYNCHTCEHFLKHFGHLVAIDGHGGLVPAMWDDLSIFPPFYVEAARWMRNTVARAAITGVFYHGKQVLGTPTTGEWSHMAVSSAKALRPSSLVKNANQQMAEKLEEFKMVQAALADFNRTTVAKALELAKTDALFRAEKIEGVLQWFLTLHKEVAPPITNRIKNNKIWKAVATAPVGYAHIRGGVAGTLLEDIKEGKSDAAIKAAFAAKMHPLQYQRPQAAPKAGNIAAADDIIEKMGIAASLKRRYATEDDILAWVWRPGKSGTKTESFHFGDVAMSVREVSPSGVVSPKTDEGNITWVKFRRDVLPLTDAIWMYTGSGSLPYTGLITATDASAPPILQWDFEDERNPVSWYVYHGGSRPHEWNLPSNQYVPVTGICLPPALWTGRYKGDSYKASAVAVLKGAYDTKISRDGNLCLFPEILKSDLHPVRATIERASKIRHLDGVDKTQAAGVRIGDHSPIKIAVRLQSGSQVGYTIDRWE